MKRTLLDFGVTKSNKKANQNTDLQTKDTELKDDGHGESLPAASTTQSCGISHTDFAYIKAKRPDSDQERYAALWDHWTLFSRQERWLERIDHLSIRA